MFVIVVSWTTGCTLQCHYNHITTHEAFQNTDLDPKPFRHIQIPDWDQDGFPLTNRWNKVFTYKGTWPHFKASYTLQYTVSWSHLHLAAWHASTWNCLYLSLLSRVSFYTLTHCTEAKSSAFFCRPHQLCFSTRGIILGMGSRPGITIRPAIDWVGQLGL